MRKTIKRIGSLAALAVGIIAFSACSKDNFISRISDTYAVQTQGSSDFFNKENGKVWDILDTKGEVKYYIYPTVPVIRYGEDASSSAATDSYMRLIKEQMGAYGYTNTADENEADIMVCMSNFQLFYNNVVWAPGEMIDLYYSFWGGYYPWLYTPVIAETYTNTFFIEMVDAESLKKYRDWYQNTWRPNNAGKYPTGSDVPEDVRPLTVWKCDITGEYTFEDETLNDPYVVDRIPKAFNQSTYMDIK